MSRIAFKIEVDLDPVPGTFNTVESARDSVQRLLRQTIPHYNPTTEVLPQVPAWDVIPADHRLLNNQIKLIKAVRACSGMSLRDARSLVESFFSTIKDYTEKHTPATSSNDGYRIRWETSGAVTVDGYFAIYYDCPAKNEFGEETWSWTEMDAVETTPVQKCANMPEARAYVFDHSTEFGIMEVMYKEDVLRNLASQEFNATTPDFMRWLEEKERIERGNQESRTGRAITSVGQLRQLLEHLDDDALIFGKEDYDPVLVRLALTDNLNPALHIF